MNQVTERTSIAIRRALEADSEALAAVERASSVQLTVEAVNWVGLFQEEGVFTYLAEDSAPFGVVSVGDSNQGHYRASVGQIRAWYLAPDYQGSGFGRKLLVHGLSVLKRREFEQAAVWLPENAARAEAVLGSLGFELDQVLPLGDVNQNGWLLDLESYF